MTNRTCPVCGLERAEVAIECGRCGWDFSPMLGTAEQTRAFSTKRLEEARGAWRQRFYDPELVPALERDPFETSEEYAARIAERPWYVGRAELQKTGYDIVTGQFPIRLLDIQHWAEQWAKNLDALFIEIPREQARSLYECSSVYPCYAWLSAGYGRVTLDSLILLATTHELSLSLPRKFRSFMDGRYCDLGDGTILDNETGLQWMRFALGQTWDGQCGNGDGAHLAWDRISTTVEVFNREGGFSGHTDWRVPELEELRTLIIPCEELWIDCHAFPDNMKGWFWSGTVDRAYPSDAWSVDFRHGVAGSLHKEHEDYVRLVRHWKIAE